MGTRSRITEFAVERNGNEDMEQWHDILDWRRRPGLPSRIFQAQNRRKLFRCQAIGLDDKDAGLPGPPDGTQPNPEESIRRSQFRSLDGALQNGELMAECEDLELKRRAAPEGSQNDGQARQ